MMNGVNKNKDMPIPTRSAPKPPGQTSQNFDWTSNDPFGPLTFEPQVQKKKPPPRPPPPRFINKQNVQINDSKIKKPTRPTELIGSLFGITTTKKQQQQQHSHQVLYDQRSSTNIQTNNSNSATGLLIDLSPPGSPTFTTRSSSDGVSVDSFGSDGNSNPSLFTSSSGNESAFDDDFDFFKNINKNKNTNQNDPWKLKDNNGYNQMPFEQFNKIKSSTNNIKFNDNNSNKQIGDSKFFINNNDTNKIHTMPTIIRAKPAKPPLPKILTRNLAPKVTNFPFNSDNNNAWTTTTTTTTASSSSSTSSSLFSRIDDDINQDDYSLPMPSIPPPAPPTHYLAESSYNTFDQCQPHGIALYDFSASQIGDLSLKKGDKVMIKKCINNEWLEGQIGNSCGIFPANFIDIIVPLNDTSINTVNALYPFKGETWEDLTFEEGAKIKVLSRISDDWLYGEYKGTKGQFPSNFVDKIPPNLPQYSQN